MSHAHEPGRDLARSEKDLRESPRPFDACEASLARVVARGQADAAHIFVVEGGEGCDRASGGQEEDKEDRQFVEELVDAIHGVGSARKHHRSVLVSEMVRAVGVEKREAMVFIYCGF